jgi:hypothetical protein
MRLNLFAGSCYAMLVALVAADAASAAEYTLAPSPRTVNIGNFSAANPPALKINSGDIVNLEASTQIEPDAVDASGVVPPSAVPQYVREIFRTVKDRGPGPHILTGPIYVNGAMPGDVLEVRILQIDLVSDYGYNRHGRSPALCPTNSPVSGSELSRSTDAPAAPPSRRVSWYRSIIPSSAPWASHHPE